MYSMFPWNRNSKKLVNQSEFPIDRDRSIPPKILEIRRENPPRIQRCVAVCLGPSRILRSKSKVQFPNIKVYVCGHSLGGALATLCFGYMVLSDYPIPVTAVYTIGQPRAGNKKFREALEFASPNTKFIRITNNQDCVPSLASGQHCGLHVHIDAAGRLTFVWFLLIFSLPPNSFPFLSSSFPLPPNSFPFLSSLYLLL